MKGCKERKKGMKGKWGMEKEDTRMQREERE
jgi:hypothetical protein